MSVSRIQHPPEHLRRFQSGPEMALPRRITWDDWLDDIGVLYGPPLHRISTLRAHRGAVRYMRQVFPTPAAVDAVGVAKLVAFLHGRGLRAATVNSVLRLVRCQANLLAQRGEIAANPFHFRKFMLPLDREDYADRRHLTREEVGRILARADLEAAAERSDLIADHGTRLWRARRVRALAYLLAYTGLRRNEALRLRIEDCRLNQEGHVGIVDIRSQTKTRASRQPVPLTEPARGVVAGWIEHVRTFSPLLFPQTRNPAKSWMEGGFAYRPTQALKQLGERAGVVGVHALAFRHSLATHAESYWGLTEAQIQRLLRHTTPMTQRHYRHADVDNLMRLGEKIQYQEGRSPPADDQ